MIPQPRSTSRVNIKFGAWPTRRAWLTPSRSRTRPARHRPRRHLRDRCDRRCCRLSRGLPLHHAEIRQGRLGDSPQKANWSALASRAKRNDTSRPSSTSRSSASAPSAPPNSSWNTYARWRNSAAANRPPATSQPSWGRGSDQLGPARARLIDKGLIYTTGHGRGDFTVPQFDRYMRRNYELAPPAPRR